VDPTPPPLAAAGGEGGAWACTGAPERLTVAAALSDMLRRTDEKNAPKVMLVYLPVIEEDERESSLTGQMIRFVVLIVCEPCMGGTVCWVCLLRFV